MTSDMRCKLQLLIKLVIGGRVPKMDEDTLEILSEESIVVYLNYLDQLKHLYSTYLHTNFNAGKRVKFSKNNLLKDFQLERH